jgi:hypothetical protein
MSKPTTEELEIALAKARQMRESGTDSDFIAKALLNYHYQTSFLEQVLQAAQHYINSGLGEREHTRLIQAMNKAREIDERSAKQEHEDLGLG